SATAAAAALTAPQAIVKQALGGEAEPELTPAVRDAIVVLKQTLARLVDAEAACLAEAKPQPGAFAQALAAHVGTAPATTGAEAPTGKPRFDVQLLQAGALLSVVARFDVPCGEDALWLLYERRAAQWRPALQWTGAAYDRIDSAWGAFQYAVSPRDADGRWFVATAHVRPWCSSAWSVIDFAIARPGAAAVKPQVLLAENHGIWWGGDDLGRLSVDAAHAELRFHGSSVDLDVHNREYVRRYAVNGTAVERVAPVASSPRGFVDEWLVSPWAQAQRWSAADTALRAAHAQLQSLRKGGATLIFGATRQCADGAVQVALDVGSGKRVFRIAGEPARYRLTAVATREDPSCTRELAEPEP
ncbi:hypothetical protein, partial [Tahibacter caeni]|uniref:hypothetical protein n=1 Tax=Tahibacter caeni TaxID=1453545 RepID=UPI002147C07B